MVKILPKQAHSGLLTFSEGLEIVRQAFLDMAENYENLGRYHSRHRQISPSGMRITNISGISPSVGVGGASLHAQRPESDSEDQVYRKEGEYATILYDEDRAELLAVVFGDLESSDFPARGLDPDPGEVGSTTFDTALRTAVGTDELAREGASTLGIFGTGRHAQNHLVAFDEIRNWKEVRVFSRSKSGRRTFAEEMATHVDAEIAPVGSPDRVIEGTDVVLCATNASTPVFDGSRLEPGQHVSSIVGSDIKLVRAGSAREPRREIDDETVERADVFVAASVSQAKHDKQGDFVYPILRGAIAWEDVIPLAKVVGGSHPGRSATEEVTVYKNNTGVGTTIAALYGEVLDRATNRDLGTHVPIEMPGEEE